MDALKRGETASGPEPSARATLSCLDGEPETLSVPWNPQSYKLHRQASFSAAAARGSRPQPRLATGGAERLWTELFLDSTGEPADRRDARRIAEKLRRWMEPIPERLLPPRVLFLWGPLRFVGFIEEMNEEWIRFDPDGTPVRGRLSLLLRS